MMKRSLTHVGQLAALASASLCLSSCSGAKPVPPNPSIKVNSQVNQLSITADRRILWNGTPVSEKRLGELLGETARLTPEPELHFLPDPHADYDMLAKAIQIIRDSRVTNFGFVGNEAYSPNGSSSD